MNLHEDVVPSGLLIPIVGSAQVNLCAPTKKKLLRKKER